MGNMRLFCIGALLLPLMLPLVTCLEEGVFSVMESIPDVTPKYDRIGEAERACEGVLDSASELGHNGNWVYSIPSDLSFTNGDWNQEPGTTRPLLPFIDAVGFNKSSAPFNLSTFSITDVKYARQSKNTVKVNGVLDLVMTREGPLPETESRELTTQFGMWNAHTQVSVFFQGVYTESEENGGERVMCLLGSGMLPARQSDSDHPWGYIKSSDQWNFQPIMFEDDKILLVLHYPLRFTLTKRKIQGEMRSLSSKSDIKYFDKVQILSQLTTQEYKFGSQPQAVHKACDPSYSNSGSLLADDVDIYKGREFCSIFEGFGRSSLFVIMSNWRCSETEEFCSKLGPFVTNDKAIDVRLLMQNVHCNQKQHAKGNVTVAKVSLVLRHATTHRNLYIEMKRNGLGNMTLAAEGMWNSSTVQLCMVGCLGIGESNACDSRVCFYIPTTFSITQRSPLMGSISSIKDKTPSYFPLSFQYPAPFLIHRYLFRYTSLRYKYSKIGPALALLGKHESSSFGKYIKTSLLKYPRMQENEDFNASLLLLGEDLTFQAQRVLDRSQDSLLHPSVAMRILSLGSILFPYSHYRNLSYAQVGSPYHEKADYTQKQLLINVSAKLLITGRTDGNFSSLFVEGLYDALVGKMYMIGCRQVQAPSKILFETKDLDRGLDCLIGVIVSYPAVTAQWLLNPTIQISITSERPEDDPFYFKPVTLKTFPILYRRQREDALSEAQLEAVLRFLTLSVVGACFLLQLLYIRRAPDSVAYVSLVMLGIQALGYGIPLITGVESLFKTKNSTEPQFTSSYEIKNSGLYNAIGFAVKLLILIAFLLTLRLLQKVWKCRVRLLRQQPCRRVPNDKLVLLITLVVHIIGSVCTLYVHGPNTHRWMIIVEEYMGVVQDLFLLPQVVGNLVWQIESKPLRKLYYIGISLVRLVPHVYDYFKASTVNPYFSKDFVFIDRETDFYSKLSDILIPAMTALLAVLVYVQQGWSYDRLSNALSIGRFRLLPILVKPYEQLPSESIEIETELTYARD